MIDFHKISQWLLLSLLLFFHQNMEGQINIDVIGTWDYTVSSNDITEAGLDFTGTYTSSVNQVTIDIFQNFFWLNFFSNYRWRVDVRKSDVDWNSNLQLYARRSGNGQPYWANGPISGGTSFQLLTNTNNELFRGRRTRTNIPIQYQLTGVSVLIPAKTYTTTVIYTVTEY